MKEICETCGTEFEYYHAPERATLMTREGTFVFCSKKCYQRFFEKRRQKKAEEE